MTIITLIHIAVIIVGLFIVVTILLSMKKITQTNSNKSGLEHIDREMKERLSKIRINMKTETSLGNRLRSIIDIIGSFDVSKMNHIDSIPSLLTTVHLPEEYILSSFKYGVEGFGYEHIDTVQNFV